MTQDRLSDDYSPDSGGVIDLQPTDSQIEQIDKYDVWSVEFWVFALMMTWWSALLGSHIQFMTDFVELLNPNSSTGRLMFAFVRRNLQAFRLDQSYKEAHILNEAFVRGLKRIHSGEIIRNPQAWLRKTAYFIIRELKREQQKVVPFEDYMLDERQVDVSSEDLEDDLATMQLALQMLKPSDQKLLNLKIVQGLSWSRIRDILIQEGDGNYDESTLRKRKERALICLRKKYHALKPPHLEEIKQR
jgi:DNA-directed RNA polymerase specialized sigma24 family protein